MRCSHCGHENANAAAVCVECLRPLELPPLEERTLREPSGPSQRAPATSAGGRLDTVTVRVLRPATRRAVLSRLPERIEPRAVHRLAPSFAAPPSAVPRVVPVPAALPEWAVATELPAVRELRLLELPGPSLRPPRARAQPVEPFVALHPARADVGGALHEPTSAILRRPPSRPVQLPLRARPGPVPLLSRRAERPAALAPALLEVAGAPARVPCGAAGVSGDLRSTVAVRALAQQLPEVRRPARRQWVPTAMQAGPASVPPLPGLAPELREAAAAPGQPAPLPVTACRMAGELLRSVPGAARLLFSAWPALTRPGGVRRVPTSRAVRPAEVPSLPALPAPLPALALQAVEDRVLAEPYRPAARSPYVPATAGGGGEPRPTPLAASASIAPVKPHLLIRTRDRPVTAPAGARPAPVPRLPSVPTVRVRVRPRIVPRPVALPGRLRPAQVVGILAVLTVTMAFVTGYWVWGPTLRESRGQRGATVGMASLALVDGGARGTYDAVVRDVWRDAVTELNRFGAVVGERDLRRIASVAGGLRVRFDVLAIDVRYLEPPAGMRGLHGSLLRAVERSAAMFEWAEALASDPLDEDAATSNAELLAAAAQQARAAYEEAQRQANALQPALSTQVWRDIERIAALAAEQRTRRPGSGGWSSREGRWGRGAAQW